MQPTSLNNYRGVSRILINYLLYNELILTQQIVCVVLEHIKKNHCWCLCQQDHHHSRFEVIRHMLFELNYILRWNKFVAVNGGVFSSPSLHCAHVCPAVKCS